MTVLSAFTSENHGQETLKLSEQSEVPFLKNLSNMSSLCTSLMLGLTRLTFVFQSDKAMQSS